MSAVTELQTLLRVYKEKPSTTTAHNIVGMVPAALRAVEEQTAQRITMAMPPQRTAPLQILEVDEIGTLLKTAESIGGRAAKLASRVRGLLEEMVPIVAMSEQERELRERVDKAARDLEKARADLKALTGRAAAPVSAKPARSTADRPPTRTVRAWAERNGVDCKPNGVIPDRVFDAYAAAGGQDL